MRSEVVPIAIFAFLFSVMIEIALTESCNFYEEAKIANCSARFAGVHFDNYVNDGSDNSNSSYNFDSRNNFVIRIGQWAHMCDEYDRFKQCVANLSFECRKSAVPKLSRLWKQLCASKPLLAQLDEERKCLETIAEDKFLQNCFKQHAITATETAHGIKDLCETAANRYKCFASFDNLAKCKNAVKLHQAFYDIIAQNIAKRDAATTTNNAETDLKTTTIQPKPTITSTNKETETIQNTKSSGSAKQKAEKVINASSNSSFTETTKNTTTITKSEAKSAEAKEKTTTAPTSSETTNLMAKPVIESKRAKRSSESKDHMNQEEKSNKSQTEDLERVNLKCAYVSVDAMIAAYEDEKEERALGGCVKVSSNDELNSKFTKITIQPNKDTENSTTFACQCISGYQIDPKTRKCVDVDECSDGSHMCSQICINKKGAYDCACEEKYGNMYELSLENNHTCVKRENASASIWLVFAHGQSIWNVSDDGRYVELKMSGLEKAAMIDVHVNENSVYFVDSGKGLLEKLSLNNESAKLELIQNYEVDGVEGIAVDYIGSNLYSARRADIFVQSLSGKYRTRLYKNKLSMPRALVIHAVEGWLFGSDWSSEAFIYRAAMDGSKFEKIITTDVVWPNGLAVDHFASRLYWADAFLDIIQSTNFDGSNRRTIIAKSGAVTHLFGLTVADQFVYWTDWNLRSILRADKLSGKNVTLLAQTTLLPYGIKAFHSAYQPVKKNVENTCHKLNCSQMCLIQPSGGENATLEHDGAICACASGFLLASDGRTCRADCREPEMNVIVCGGSEPKCVNKRYVCDGILHCPDRLDEQNCPERVCPIGEFQCADKPSQCVDPSAVCDGQNQCQDASDERFCEIRS